MNDQYSMLIKTRHGCYQHLPPITVVWRWWRPHVFGVKNKCEFYATIELPLIALFKSAVDFGCSHDTNSRVSPELLYAGHYSHYKPFDRVIQICIWHKLITNTRPCECLLSGCRNELNPHMYLSNRVPRTRLMDWIDSWMWMRTSVKYGWNNLDRMCRLHCRTNIATLHAIVLRSGLDSHD
jgi:hypothetical protein